jgi:hypothetical protein
MEITMVDPMLAITVYMLGCGSSIALFGYWGWGLLKSLVGCLVWPLLAFAELFYIVWITLCNSVGWIWNKLFGEQK